MRVRTTQHQKQLATEEEPLHLAHLADSVQDSEPDSPITRLRQSEPFWHQHPYWAQPPDPPFKSSDVDYLDHLLILDLIMEDKPVVIGYAVNQGGPKKRPELRPMVEVYIGDEYVEKISRGVLARFSQVAVEALSRQKKIHYPRQEEKGLAEKGADDAHSYETSMVSSAHAHHAWRAKVSGEKFSSVDMASKTRNSSDTWATISHRPGVDPAVYFMMNVRELPTAGAIKFALKWMKDNASSSHTEKLVDYGPSNMREISLDSLLDLYQAALILGMRPTPKRLRRAVLEHITDMPPPDAETLGKILGWLPVNDPATARVLNVVDKAMGKHAYMKTEVDRLNAFVLHPDNAHIRAKLTQILQARADRFRAHREEIGDGRQQYRRRGTGEAKGFHDTQNGTMARPVSTPETAGQNIAHAKYGGRRRNRRQQVKNGKTRQAVGH